MRHRLQEIKNREGESYLEAIKHLKVDKLAARQV